MYKPRLASTSQHSIGIGYATLMFCVLWIAGCASDTSYDRHNLSRVWLTQDGKHLFYDATASNAYPADSDAAEAVRLQWLGEWLEIRKLCVSGHTVSERRAIRADEYNPQRHNLRYKIECKG